MLFNVAKVHLLLLAILISKIAIANNDLSNVSFHQSIKKEDINNKEFITLGFKNFDHLPENLQYRFKRYLSSKDLESSKDNYLTLIFAINNLQDRLSNENKIIITHTKSDKEKVKRHIRKEKLDFLRRNKICDTALDFVSRNDSLLPVVLFLDHLGIVDDGDDKGYTHEQRFHYAKNIDCNITDHKTMAKHIGFSISSGLSTSVGDKFDGCKREDSECAFQRVLNKTDVNISVSKSQQYKEDYKFKASAKLGFTSYNNDADGVGSSLQRQWHNSINSIRPGSATTYLTENNNGFSRSELIDTYVGVSGDIARSVMLGNRLQLTVSADGSFALGEKTDLIADGDVGAELIMQIKGKYNLSIFGGYQLHRSKAVASPLTFDWILSIRKIVFKNEIEISDDYETHSSSTLGVGLSDGINTFKFAVRKGVDNNIQEAGNGKEDENIFELRFTRSGKVPKQGKLESINGIEPSVKDIVAYRFSGFD